MSKVKVVCLVFLGFLFFMCPQAWADSGCVPVSIQSAATADNPANPFEMFKGTMVASMNGQPPVEAPFTSIPQKIKLGADGTIHIVTELTIFLPDGSTLRLLDQAVFALTDVPFIYRVNSRLSIIEGTGMFADTCGSFVGHGSLNMATLHVEVVSDGKICW